jgi:ABC-type nickel/cobalt efflux system permease component RcnA
MAKKLPTILSLGAALAALQGVYAVNATSAAASIPRSNEANATQSGRVAQGEPNVFMSVGNDLLGLIVTTKADGTVVADHYSHSSHSSHSSHYSSR